MIDFKAETFGYPTNFIRLPWSKIRRIKDIQDDVVLSIKITAVTRSLSVPTLSPRREKRLDLLSRLYDQGITTRQISDWFNDIGMPTERGTIWYPSLVHSMIKKWKRRQLRLIDNYVVSDPPRFLLRVTEKRYTSDTD